MAPGHPGSGAALERRRGRGAVRGRGPEAALSRGSRSARSEIKRSYKEAPVVAGLWLIRNLDSGKVLLGVALNAPSRLNRARFELDLGRHDCAELQADRLRLGPERFSFEVAEALKRPEDDLYFDVPAALKGMERSWLDKLRPWDERGYHPRP